MHSGETCQRLGRIPLVLGMPVIVCQNFDVSGGIVNGSIGKLVKIRYRLDTITGNRFMTSAVVRLPHAPSSDMTALTATDYPVLEDTV
ncbi:hypothetical protein C2E23DRAFT_691094, partial [Lenzites betulinus]